MSESIPSPFFKIFLVCLVPIVLLALLSIKVNAEISAPNIEWEKSYGGTKLDSLTAIQQTSDGGYIMAGWSLSKDGEVTGNHGESDYWLIKSDSVGNIQWKRTYGGKKWDYASSIQETSAGFFIVAGTSESNDGDVSENHGSDDFWIILLDIQGNLIWQKTFGGSQRDISPLIRETAEGGFIIVGETSSTDGDVTGNHGGSDYWLIKIDQLGNMQWEKCLGGSQDEVPRSIQITPGNGYIIAGSSLSNDGDVRGNHGKSDFWIVLVDDLGNIQWQKSLGGSETDKAYSIQNTSDGGFISAGVTQSNDGDVTNNPEKQDCWIVKLDSQGNITWEKIYGGSDLDQANSIQETSEGGFIIAGATKSNDGDVTGNHGDLDYWLLKIDAQGNLMWQKNFGGSGKDQANSIQETSDGGFMLAGSSRSNDGDVTRNHGKFDFWIIKIESAENKREPTNNPEEN